MDVNQKQFIDDHIVELVDDTQLNVSLFTYCTQHKLLIAEDVDRIQTRCNNTSDRAGRVLFYEIVKGKHNGFPILLNAMDKSGQTGAFVTLQRFTGNPTKSAVTNVNQASNLNTEETYRTLIVGDDGCDIDDMLEALKKSKTESIYNNDWPNLARKLKISRTQVDDWKKAILLDKINAFEIFDKMLIIWGNESGQDATLGKFMDIIKGLKWVDFLGSKVYKA